MLRTLTGARRPGSRGQSVAQILTTRCRRKWELRHGWNARMVTSYVPPMPFRPHLIGAWPYGCLFAGLLGMAMAFVIFVGSVMGDCGPGAGCHENDGAVIGQGLLLAAPIVLAFSAAAWLLLAGVRALLKERLGEDSLVGLLILLALALAWFSFGPAFEVYFWWTAG